jgi:hypothetical protein
MENPMSCFICKKSSCIEVGSASLCLLHYVTKESNNNEIVIVSDKEELAVQSVLVRDMWSNAITDVLLQMYDLQKEEEESIRRDPLSLLTMGTAGPIPVPYLDESSIMKKKHTSLNSTQDSTKSTLWNIHKNDSKTEIPLNNISSYCERCGSHEVSTRYSSNNDCNRSEIWGSKEALKSTETVTCLKCGYSVVNEF